MVRNYKTEKVLHGYHMDFLNRIRLSVLLHSGGRHRRAAVEEKPKPPGVSPMRIIAISYRKVSRWNVTIP